MKLNKAIEILEGEAHLAERQPETGVYDAIKLLIEAGKDYQKAQDAGWYPPGYKLPGETLE